MAEIVRDDDDPTPEESDDADGNSPQEADQQEQATAEDADTTPETPQPRDEDDAEETQEAGRDVDDDEPNEMDAEEAGREDVADDQWDETLFSDESGATAHIIEDEEGAKQVSADTDLDALNYRQLQTLAGFFDDVAGNQSEENLRDGLAEKQADE